MIKLKIISLILIFNIGIKLANTQNKTEIFADSLYQRGQYTSALKEYLRCTFYEESGLSKDIYLKISDIFLKLNNFDKSLEFLDSHYYRNFQNNNEKNHALLKKTQVLIINNKYNDALLNILQIKTQKSEELDTKYFYEGILYLLLKNESKSLAALSNISYINKDQVAHLSILINKAIKKYGRNKNFATFQSAIIPGLGQTTHGDINDGLKSFFLVGSLAVLFIDVSLAYSIPNAIISVGPWLTRYYIGGITNTSKIAIKKQKTDFNKAIINLIQYLESSRIK